MQSLLGRIIALKSDESRHTITIEPLCTLPDRKAPPDHLKNQKLTFEREVTDAREIGELGDSITLTVKESRKLLRPLSIVRQPDSLNFDLTLHWFKDEKPPDWTAQAGNKLWRGGWENEGSFYHAGLDISKRNRPKTPFEIEVSCADFKVKRTVEPDEPPCITRIHTPYGEEFRAANQWIEVGITPKSGGAITMLWHHYGISNHFLPLPRLIHHPLDWAGHTDRFRTGWGEWKEMREAKMEVVGAMREANTSRVNMQGEIEDGLRTQFSATLLDDWPLLLTRREFSLHPKKEDKKAEDEFKQPIDEMRLFQSGFRCAVAPDKKSSRVWCRADGETVPFSLARENEHQSFWHWKMEEGFALFEQRGRREWLLYFFDSNNAPHLGLWRGSHVATLEPFWAGVPLKPGESTGFSLGLAAGESGGASDLGAWVACRTIRENQWNCALLARCFLPNAVAVFQIAEQMQHVALVPMFLPGIGTVYGASARFEMNDKNEAFEAHLEGGT